MRVPNGSSRGGSESGRPQRLDLGDQSVCPHLPHPIVESRYEDIASGTKTNHDGRLPRRPVLWQAWGEAAFEFNDLERSHHPSTVGGVDLRRRRRIEAREPRVQASRAEALEVGFEARPNLVVSRREGEILDHAAHIEPGASGEHWDHAVRLQPLDGRSSLALVLGDRRILRWLEHVEQVVCDATSISDGQLRCPDIHASIQLHGVSVDDLSGPATGSQRLDEVECQG